MKEKDLTVGITGFIDILGFGAKVLNAKTINDINVIETNIKIIQDEFDFDSNDDFTRLAQKETATNVLAFSDCVIVNIPLQSSATEYSGQFDVLCSEIAGFAYAQGNCVSKSLFVRGGIELGWWHQHKATLISQSLLGAYKMEQNADVPVIAICEQLYKYLSENFDREHYSEELDPLLMFRKYKSETETFYYIDYISICLEAMPWQVSEEQIQQYQKTSGSQKDEIVNAGHKYNIERWLINHARNIEKAEKEAPTNKVKSKYQWLSVYHNEIAKQYSRNDECFCSVQGGNNLY